MSLVLDAGALVAVARRDRETLALIKRELVGGRVPVTHAGMIGQVWRGGTGRQASLARFLPGVQVAGGRGRSARRRGVDVIGGRLAP